MSEKKQITMSEDEFYEKYNPLKNHLDSDAAFDGCMFETFGEEVEFINKIAESLVKGKIWTIIEVEGKFYFVSGWHFINRFGYLVTEEIVPDDEEIEVKLDEPEMRIAKFVKEITVIDPDTKGKVQLAVYKHEGGGMFAIDSSFLDQCARCDDFHEPIIPDPFSDNGVEEGSVSLVMLFD